MAETNAGIHPKLSSVFYPFSLSIKQQGWDRRMQSVRGLLSQYQ